MKNVSKLTAEKNKEPAYTSVGFENCKKGPECFKDHQNSKCHKETATLAVIVPSCGDFQNTTFENMVKIYDDNSTIRQIYSSLAILNTYKTFAGKLGVCEIGNDFISKQYGRFTKADFI